MITTAIHNQSNIGRPMELVTQAYRVAPGAVRHLRRRVTDTVLDSLNASNWRQAFAAAELLEHALRDPDGPSDQPPSNLEQAAWKEEFQDTLQRLNVVLDQHPLPASVQYGVARSVARFFCSAPSVASRTLC